jgi:tRNA G18 (ribose-2'-O)-methylase SpoU
MRTQFVSSLDDPRVELYRNLKDHELDRRGRFFIAEGEHLLRRLLASDFEIESVLMSDRRVEELAPLVADRAPIYVVSHALMHDILGMKFHSGVMAAGRRKPRATIDQIMPRDREQLTLVICPEIANVENIGSMIRLSAGFGADAMILGERCHDPFWRQSIRVSMGTVFKLPIVQSDDLARDLRRLREEWNVELIATVLDPSAEPLAQSQRRKRMGLLFGNEAQGLDEHWIATCDRKVTIPMHHGTDSLNVAVAAGIFLYHFSSSAQIAK